MHIDTIKTTNMELTDAIHDYVMEKFLTLEKLTADYDDVAQLRVECAKTTKHHQKGEVFMCEATLEAPGQVFRVSKESDDLYKAIGKTVDHLWRSLKEYKDKNFNKGKSSDRPDKE